LGNQNGRDMHHASKRGNTISQANINSKSKFSIVIYSPKKKREKKVPELYSLPLPALASQYFLEL